MGGTVTSFGVHWLYADVPLLVKARYLFDVATKHAWDPEHGGLAYSIDLDGSVCNWDKIFWVQCESIGTAAMLARATGKAEYSKWTTSYYNPNRNNNVA